MRFKGDNSAVLAVAPFVFEGCSVRATGHLPRIPHGSSSPESPAFWSTRSRARKCTVGKQSPAGRQASAGGRNVGASRGRRLGHET